MFRIGEPHGAITPRVEELVEWFRGIDSAKATTNLWGERWSKLVQNSMGNGVTAATGLTSSDCLRDPAIRRFQIALAAEAVRVGQALGYQLEKIRGADPEQIARANEGDSRALAEVEALIVPKAGSNPRADIQRPSMAQDILKGRRTEIDAMNGYIARKGAEVGVPAPSHEKLAEIVTRIERGELKPSPSLLAEAQVLGVHCERQVLARLAAVGRADALDLEVVEQHRHHHLHLENREIAPSTGAGRRRTAWRRAWATRRTPDSQRRDRSARVGARLVGRSRAHQAHEERALRHLDAGDHRVARGLQDDDRRHRLERMVSLMHASMNGSAVMLS